MATLKQQLAEIERGLLIQALWDAGLNISKAAKHLGLHRNLMLRHCKVCDIDLKQLRKNWRTASLLAERKSLGRN